MHWNASFLNVQPIIMQCCLAMNFNCFNVWKAGALMTPRNVNCLGLKWVSLAVFQQHKLHKLASYNGVQPLVNALKATRRTKSWCKCKIEIFNYTYQYCDLTSWIFIKISKLYDGFPLQACKSLTVQAVKAMRSIIAWPGVHMMVINLPKHLLV